MTKDSLANGSIEVNALADADEIGDTIMFQAGSWRYRSISGLNLRGDWDPSQPVPDNDLVEGDY